MCAAAAAAVDDAAPWIDATSPAGAPPREHPVAAAPPGGTVAVILATRRFATGAPVAAARVAGLTLLERCLFLAREAGATRAVVVGEAAALGALRAAVRRRDLRLPVEWTPLAGDAASRHLRGARHVLLLRGDVALAPRLARRLDAAAASGMVLVDEDVSAKPAAGLALDAGRRWIGAARLSPGLATRVLAALRSDPAAGDAAALRVALAAGEVAPAPVERSWYPVRAPRDLAAARVALLAALGKPQDGWVSRHCNRPVSTAISRLLVETRVTPNAVSAGVFGLRLGAGALIALGGRYWLPLLGFVLLQLASILDGCDGELARVRYQGSRLGAWLDTTLDHCATLVLTVAVATNLTRHGGGAAALAMAAVTVVGGVVAMAAMFSYLRAIGSGSGFDVPGLPPPSACRHPVAKALVVVGNLTRLDAMYLVFLGCGLVGQLWSVQTLLFLGGVGLPIFYVRRRLQLAAARRRAPSARAPGAPACIPCRAPATP